MALQQYIYASLLYRNVRKINIILLLLTASLPAVSVLADSSTGSNTTNGFSIWVQVQGTLTPTRNGVTGFHYYTSASSTNHTGIGLAFLVDYRYYINGTEHRLVVNGVQCPCVFEVIGGWSSYVKADGPSGITAREVVNQGWTGYAISAPPYFVQVTPLVDAGLPFN